MRLVKKMKMKKGRGKGKEGEYVFGCIFLILKNVYSFLKNYLFKCKNAIYK